MNSSHRPSRRLPGRRIVAALAAAGCAAACLVPAGAAAAASTGASGAKAAPTRSGGGRPVPARASGIRHWAVAGGYYPARVGGAELSGWGRSPVRVLRLCPGRVGAGAAGPVRRGGRPGNGHDLRREREQRQRPGKPWRGHRLGDRRAPLPGAGRVPVQGAMADGEGRQLPDDYCGGSGHRHGVCDGAWRQHRRRCSTARPATAR